jgi:amidase
LFRGADMGELWRMSAVELVAALRRGALSPLDCLDALEARIRDVDPKVNAFPTLCFDRARDRARRLMRRPADRRGPLAGLPVPIKDLADVAGVRSTQGSPIYADRVPETSDVLVEHLEANGGVVYGMTNTPEFGAGANTFNAVFGRTLNPWNLARSPAGSSGGAAAALATGMAWVAHGSDLGGSLRNPASFCGVVGFRPSPGRVAATPGASIGGMLSVEGPMARTVEDAALLFDAMVGEEIADPVSLPAPPWSFIAACRTGRKPARVAVSRDLGVTPVDPQIADAVMAAARKLEAEGVIVEEAHPDFSEAHECFQTLRAFGYALWGKALIATHRHLLKDDVIWNIEKGLALTVDDLLRAENQRADLYRRAVGFFAAYDLLLCPATITAAFPVEQRYLAELNGRRFANYVEWLAIVYAITLVACPALSIPCGFTSEGLPIGLQVVARPRGDAMALSGARFIEETLALGPITPIDPRPAA